MCDLGVIVEPNLRYRGHILEVARSASMVSNLMRRTFISERHDLYLMLFKSFVLSKFPYCSQVWSPHLAQDKASHESVCKHFLKFVARRCKLDVSELCNPTVESLHRQIDLSQYVP